jgi:hypothetical protein
VFVTYIRHVLLLMDIQALELIEREARRLKASLVSGLGKDMTDASSLTSGVWEEFLPGCVS